MSLDFVLQSRCGLCGWINRGRAFYSGCRVNKNSIVTGPGLVWGGHSSCRECGWPAPERAVVVEALTPESAAKVRALRAKRGWAVAA